MLIFRATFRDMIRDPHSYAFMPGGGYIQVGPIKVGEQIAPGIFRKRVFGDHKKDLCNPPPDAQHRSWHTLNPPGGGKPLAFQWLAGAQQYLRVDPRAHRMGFPPAYLSSWGWVYKSRGKDELAQ